MLQYSIIEKRENLRRCATASTMMSDCDEDDDAGEVSTCESKLGNDKIQDFVPVASKVEQTTNSALEVLTTEVSFLLKEIQSMVAVKQCYCPCCTEPCVTLSLFTMFIFAKN